MDDNAFCAVCDRQIVPKRTLVPVYPAPEPSPEAPRQKKMGRTGLVHGTGRVRPNGTLKAATPVKTRIEIDQSPAPLYCSDQCRQRDTAFFHGAPVFPDTSDTSDEQDYDDDYPAWQRTHRQQRSTPNTRSLAVLQREYNMGPLPPPTCATYDELAPQNPARAEYVPPPYTSGIMMASRRIDAVLPKPLKPGERPPPLKPVPGWTDGSQAWRASTYSFAPPPTTRADVLDPNTRAYGTFSASPHRSAQSGVTASSASSSGSLHSPTSASSSSLNSELLSSFEDSFARRTSSRLSLASSPASCSTSPAFSTSPPRRTKHLAASQLLVPDVLLRPAAPKHTSSISSRLSASSSDIASQHHGSERQARRHSSGSFNAQHRVRSPLSNAGSVVSGSGSGSSSSGSSAHDELEEAAYLKTVPMGDIAAPPARPNIETRSWSYDNVRTYPVMVPTETRVERRIEVVDGEEREVEVRVEVPVPPERRHRKRLFTFAPVVVSRGAGAVAA
ncbi:hypothetical protein C8R45DRAFT_922312 [Mycena sanguinolenta]|nr:hypothetical protein C8R45DRAFT_922312 [Mycena sanguinolenta]